MNNFLLIVLTLALAIPALAQDNITITNTLADTNAPAVVELPASAATLTAPLVLTNGYLCLTNDGMADVTSGGKAVFSFSVTNAGNYVIEAEAHGPDDSSNSYFVNMDAMPADDMIWDVEVSDGFEKHLMNWRGSGDATNDEFSPKVFKLEPGKHQLILVGREPGTELKSITIRPVRNAPANIQSH